MHTTILNKSIGKSVLFFFLLGCGSTGMAQRIALKTNALYWATLSPNIGGEFRLARHFTLDMNVAGNFISSDKRQLKFQQFAPELRYWPGRPMARNFFGITTSYTNFNLRFNKNCYDGDAFAAGLAYGFNWVIGGRWNIETSLGAGLLSYRVFDYKTDAQKPLSPNKNKVILAPIKAEVSLTYLLF